MRSLDKMAFEKDLKKLMWKLNKVSEKARKDSKAALREGAKYLRKEIAIRTPVYHEEHYTRKGEIIKPGNLRKSIMIFTFRRSPDVFVGPRIGPKAKNDGYYAHWVEFGVPSKKYPPNPFVRAGIAAAGTLPTDIAARIIAKKIDTYAGKLYNL